MTLPPEIQALKERHERAAHATMAALGVEMAQTWHASAQDAKHLRLGINLSMRDHGSLAELLIRKGVITELEYFTAITEGAEAEAAMCAARAIEMCGLPPNTEFV